MRMRRVATRGWLRVRGVEGFGSSGLWWFGLAVSRACAWSCVRPQAGSFMVRSRFAGVVRGSGFLRKFAVSVAFFAVTCGKPRSSCRFASSWFPG